MTGQKLANTKQPESAEIKIVQPLPLTAARFSPYGDVIEVSDATRKLSINQGFTQRFHDLANIDVSAENGKVCVSIFRTSPLPEPIELNTMERHPLSSQAFIPLEQKPYLVAVAPPGNFNLDLLEVFIAQGTQGVNYFPGTWHHFSLALHETSDFLVIDRQEEPGNNKTPTANCDEIQLDKTVRINR